MPINANAGSKRKPTALHTIQGTPKAKLKDRANEPKPKAAIPARPENMSDKAQAAWDRLCPLIGGMNILTLVDGAALERMCELYHDIMECQAALRRDGYTYTSTNEETGQTLIKAHPALAAKRSFEMAFKAYLEQFGLTPASRARVSMVGDGDGEDDDGLLD